MLLLSIRKAYSPEELITFENGKLTKLELFIITLCTPSLLLGVNVLGFFCDSMKACILEKVGILESLKKALVEPDSRQPYLILVCLARSSADSMGDSILSTVRKAARLAV